jgi:hypothetical protein
MNRKFLRKENMVDFLCNVLKWDITLSRFFCSTMIDRGKLCRGAVENRPGVFEVMGQ